MQHIISKVEAARKEYHFSQSNDLSPPWRERKMKFVKGFIPIFMLEIDHQSLSLHAFMLQSTIHHGLHRDIAEFEFMTPCAF